MPEILPNVCPFLLTRQLRFSIIAGLSTPLLRAITVLPFVISTGAPQERSGEICGFRIPTPLLRAITALPFVISTGAPQERSGEICGFLIPTPLLRAITVLPFVISTGAPQERSGEICGFLISTPLLRAITALPFVISTGAPQERSGEICGFRIPTPGPAGPGGGPAAASYVGSFTNPGSGGGPTFYASPTINSYGTDIANNTTIASSTQANFITSPVACTVAALNVGINNYSSPGADTTTIKVYKNTVATPMTCSVNTDGNVSGCTDSTPTFSVVQGDSLALGVSETNSNPFNMGTVGLVCQ